MSLMDPLWICVPRPTEGKEKKQTKNNNKTKQKKSWQTKIKHTKKENKNDLWLMENNPAGGNPHYHITGQH